MSRTLTASTVTKVATKLGTDPVIVVEFDWPPLRRYADRDYDGLEGRIIDIGPIDSIVKLRGGSASGVAITLDDSDGAIKAILDTYDIHKRPAKVYQCYNGLTFTDAALLVAGEITTPMQWNEGERTVTLNIETQLEESEIGFAPEENEFDFLSKDAIGQAWPLVFGSVIHVPAVLITEKVRGTCLSRYSLVTSGELDDVCEAAQAVLTASSEKRIAEQKPLSDVTITYEGETISISVAEYDAVLSNLSQANNALALAVESILLTYTPLDAGIPFSVSGASHLSQYITSCQKTLWYSISITNLAAQLVEMKALLASTLAALELARANLEAELAKEVSDPKIIDVFEAQIAFLEVVKNQPGDTAFVNRSTGIFQSVLTSGETLTDADLGTRLDRVNGDLEAEKGKDGDVDKMASAADELHAAFEGVPELKQRVRYVETLIATYQNLLVRENIAQSIIRNSLQRPTLTELIIEDGDQFPQGTNVRIVVAGARFTGVFSGRTFTVGGFMATHFGSASFLSSSTFTIADPTMDVKGMYCYNGKHVVFVNNQEGTKCYYSPVLWAAGAIRRIQPVAGLFYSRQTYDVTTFEGAFEAQPWFNPSWRFREGPLFIVDRANDYNTPDFVSGLSGLPDSDWGIEFGDEVYLDNDYKDIFVANLITSTEVKEVKAFRSFDGRRVLSPVPSSYYTVDLSASLAGQTCTTITVRKPLPEFIDEGWGRDIFVTLVSSEGPNTADIIEYLIDTYSEMSVDATTFAAVNTFLTNYPSHFAFLEQKSLVTAIEEVAFQARCAVFLKNETYHIKFLAADPATDATITEAGIDNASLVVDYTETDELVTKFIAIWRDDLASEDPDFRFILRNNIAKYGLHEREFDFYIYNIESLVEKSAFFWMVRMSNTWKVLKFSTPLDMLKLEGYDAFNLNFTNPLVADAAVKGIIRSAVYDPNEYKIDFDVQTEVKAGTMTAYAFFFPASASGTEEYPTATDLFAGG